jgi:hypothetical protein
MIPAAARACSVCFGADAEQAGLGAAFNLAITILLGVTFALIASGIAWVARMEKRRRALDARYFELLELVEPREAPHAR